METQQIKMECLRMAISVNSGLGLTMTSEKVLDDAKLIYNWIKDDNG